MRILVILPNNLGDVIMTTPVLEGLRKKYPDAYISYLVEEGFSAALDNSPHINELIHIPRKTLRNLIATSPWPDALAKFRSFFKKLNADPYDHIINLSQHSYISHCIPLIDHKTHVGKSFLPEGNHAVDDKWSRYLYAVAFARRFNELHAVDVYRRIAGVTAHCGGYTISLKEDEKKMAGIRIAKAGIDLNTQLAVFQPGAAFSSKRWPAEHFIRLAKLLIHEGWNIAISGSPSEIELADNIAEAVGEGAYSFAGTGTFREAIALVSHADACVSGDTALMHAASALNVKTYAIFGATNPIETGPYGNGHYIFSAYCSQRPCFSDKCQSMLCMKAVLPDTIAHVILKQKIPPNTRSDIFRSIVVDNGDYSLININGNVQAYHDTTCAALTRVFLGGTVDLARYKPLWNASCNSEIEQVIFSLEKMARYGNAYLQTQNPSEIHSFETEKKTIEMVGGIGAFFCAVLNISLNSVPVIDPIAALQKSIAICDEMAQKLICITT